MAAMLQSGKLHRRKNMRVKTNYVQGKPKTEIYNNGNDIYYDGTIYRLPESAFEPVFFRSELESHPMLYWEDEVIIWIFVDNADDIEKTEWEFANIPAECYETCPIVSVPSIANDVQNNHTS
jgi:hypothetical protein